MLNKIYAYFMLEEGLVDYFKAKEMSNNEKYDEGEINNFIFDKIFWKLIWIRSLIFLIVPILCSFISLIIIILSSHFLGVIKIDFGGLVIILSAPIFILFLINITNTSIVMFESIKKFLLILVYFLNPLKFILNYPLIFLIELFIAGIYIFGISIYSLSFTFNSVETDIAIEIFKKEKGMTFFISLLVVHAAIYFFIRVYGQPTRTFRQKLKKIKMQFYLWFCSMLVSLVYIFISIFNTLNGMQALYFTFVLMISLERVVTHYKKLVDFLDEYNMYNELKMKLKSEVSKPYNY
ncbi:hypothetical protein CN470_29375 [Bacillus cereus]|uniref:hypothetical protein n=1 Tax=Bacillus cereus TaxID=1396 RepID=UPI000BF797B6|nr:hypothetical protein [Bacillus cereus]PEQ56896.1 hypothetical protein CN470_29375 [Bacillus cereus]PER60189.1 hypothetical protein CN503_25700 [Bacillus cereus]PFM08353.1 hypothetical protein COJ39_16620 [Bacillus cereus]